ncbi:phage baseplate upper protein [Bacillus subtilis]|uniref:phage baseplate upper protein n=1 Tax=Bacillus subtilis TaxID=1423 RepID=UPI002938D325|nr:phage baseplate upper protein [Bacillus subtilis]WNA14189.1 baseplate upper protein [Bacillus phage phi18-2]WOF29600.1 phage baseplate upper protein [Bacillus subtilis]
MIYNDAKQSFEITASTKRKITTGIQFSTQDIDTARLIFTLTKDREPLPLSAVSGKLVMFMADGSRFIKNVEIVDPVGGVAQYVLTSDEIKHYGTVNAELNLYYANNQALSVHKFSFNIDRALVDTDIAPIAEYYIDDFEALIAKVNELYDEAIATMEELRQKFSDLENIETKTGAQEKADAAEANAKAYTDVHANNKTIHITADERTTWNAKETTTGSQSKADKALGDAKAYTDTHANRTDNPHEVTKAQIGLANVEDIKQASFTDFQAHNYNQVRHISADERTAWNAKETTDGAQAKADKALTDAKAYTDTKVGQLTRTWTTIPLINGAVTDTTVPLRYRTKNGGDELQINGGFKSAFGTIIATGLPKVKYPTEFLVATVGTYGYLRMDYRVNGDLYLAGGTVNSETGISKISVNITIPLT